MSVNLKDKDVPLCVDLDGTLIQTDLLYESAIYLLKKNLFYIFLIPFWLIKGRYFLKFKLLEFVSPTISSMPYNQELIDFIKSEKINGRKIILITATAQPLADKVADFINLFDEVVGSKDGINLVGQNKAKYLINRFGANNFDYVGDSFKDIFVWKFSRNALVVSDNDKLISEAQKVVNVSQVFDTKVNKFATILKQIRVHQWIKNTLIFLPPLLAHKNSIDDYILAIWGFFAFSLIASGIYVINDLADIESDRNHPSKSKRPIASGKLKILTSLKLIPLLLLSGLFISIVFVGNHFTNILLLYTALTILYSFKLKKMYLLDMITLSMLYTIRLISGGIATNTELSPWLFSFAMFVFLSLGAMKRYTELIGLSVLNSTKVRGRDYYIDDIPLIGTIGISSGIISTLVFTLYIVNPDVIILYQNPHLLYFIAPLVLYWILRMWFIAHRGEMDDDPIVFALKDKTSYLITAIIFMIAIGASF